MTAQEAKLVDLGWRCGVAAYYLKADFSLCLAAMRAKGIASKHRPTVRAAFFRGVRDAESRERQGMPFPVVDGAKSHRSQYQERLARVLNGG